MCEWILNYLSWLTNLQWKWSTPALRIVFKVSQKKKKQLYFWNLKTVSGFFGSFYHLMTNKSTWFCINPVVFFTVCMTDKSRRNLQVHQAQNRILEIIFTWKSSNHREDFFILLSSGATLSNFSKSNIGSVRNSSLQGAFLNLEKWQWGKKGEARRQKREHI